MTDMLFKYFLGYKPEDTKLIDPSLLTVFRCERLIDNDENLMDKLIEKTVELAIEKGFIEAKNKIIVDSTYTNAMYSNISPREKLIRQGCNSMNATIIKWSIGENIFTCCRAFLYLSWYNN